jgi:hypothetical protein
VPFRDANAGGGARCAKRGFASALIPPRLKLTGGALLHFCRDKLRS